MVSESGYHSPLDYSPVGVSQKKTPKTARGLHRYIELTLVLLCQLGCPRTSRPLDWHEKVCCHAVCLPLANMEHGVADPRYKRLLG